MTHWGKYSVTELQETCESKGGGGETPVPHVAHENVPLSGYGLEAA